MARAPRRCAVMSSLHPERAASLRGRFEAHGFVHEHTGGNCTALVCYTPHAEFYVLQECDGTPEPLAPKRTSDRVCVGRVPIVGGEPLTEDWSALWHGTAVALLTALDGSTSDWLGIGERRGREYAP